MAPLSLAQQSYSLDHAAWVDLLATTEDLLIIQDLDGVCMGLVKDPLQRTIDPTYLRAVPAFASHFYVLTNGEHTGQRGVNGIVNRAVGEAVAQAEGLYLPGLAAGGVQWQTCQGQVSHPGVSQAELAFLAAVPGRIRTCLAQFFQQQPTALAAADLASALDASALDNVASPTANLNTLYELVQAAPATYRALQTTMATLMDDLLQEAGRQGMGESFFVHYAPNRGRGEDGKERLWLAEDGASGTTDFQFMLGGAIKEAGVLALLNRYYGQRYGTFPLGPDFSVRRAPRQQAELLALVEQAFDPARMPILVGVGDTVTSVVTGQDSQPVAQRGGSDRNFLQLIQALGERFDRPNVVTYVDSSGGELKNRRPLRLDTVNGETVVVAGPGDPRDTADPLRLNVVFPGGFQQYCQAFQAAAQGRAVSVGHPVG